MTLTNVKPGDIVLADHEHLIVLSKEGRQLRCHVANRATVLRTVGARQVDAHWRKSKAA